MCKKTVFDKGCVLLAIGGHALVKGKRGDFKDQLEETRETCKHVVELLERGFNVVITHGNGLQVGNELLRMELSKGKVSPLPLYVCGACTQGTIGYTIQITLLNELMISGVWRPVTPIVTPVIVDRHDLAFKEPTKFIGPFYGESEAKKIAEKNWVIKKDADRGYRRVVPSPFPKRIVGIEGIKELVNRGHIVISCGGGGIPVIEKEDGTLEGVDAVIDKDFASMVLAIELGIKRIIMVTDVEKVFLNYLTENQVPIDEMSLEEAEKYLGDGHFPPGSMGPKIKAVINFLKKGGEEVVILSIENIGKALEKGVGTTIHA